MFLPGFVVYMDPWTKARQRRNIATRAMKHDEEAGKRREAVDLLPVRGSCWMPGYVIRADEGGKPYAAVL
ncbi:hypothetical protein L249_0658 [Ophiocordyceps polyrhachis-furcata BCC 54312]|uniref:Uncharacterized protein n=1 Tax=Ophiocordyceps polyrhachis-furcata BCC 54312 TaxID=1330021 RepID=A0A367LG26_9HYPO|nr:hypothetical protein L249_0658 [Ophiocordyceps polyrhachis-furcata BCC 54312]